MGWSGSLSASKDWWNIAEIKKIKSATALDLSLGFYLILLDEESQKVCSKILPWGRCSYLRLSMGVSCALSMFQSIMTKTLRRLEDWIYLYIMMLFYWFSDNCNQLKIVSFKLSKFLNNYSRQGSKPTCKKILHVEKCWILGASINK